MWECGVVPGCAFCVCVLVLMRMFVHVHVHESVCMPASLCACMHSLGACLCEHISVYTRALVHTLTLVSYQLESPSEFAKASRQAKGKAIYPDTV